MAELITESNFIKSFISIKKDEIIKDFVDSILDSVIFISNNHYIKWINCEGLNILGYKEGEITGKKLDCVLAKDFSSQRDVLFDLMAKGHVKNYDITLKRQDGTEFPVKMNIVPFTDNAGATTGWLIMIKDMTETRNLVKRLVNSSRRLQYTIKELEHSRDELIHSEKLSFAGRIAASVAHEIRNPLNIIGMAIQQLHTELGKKDSRKEYTKMIMGHINRVSKLLTEFVDVTSPPKLKIRLEDINTILEEVLKLIEPKIQERKAKVIKSLDRDLPEIGMDRDHMVQAITNLLLNSCEAMPKRGGKIWITSTREHNFIVIRLRNTGRSIPKKDLIRIGEPFFSSKGGGTGLGMSVAYSIIGSHRGTISIESNKKIGTVFNITLSLSKERKIAL